MVLDKNNLLLETKKMSYGWAKSLQGDQSYGCLKSVRGFAIYSTNYPPLKIILPANQEFWEKNQSCRIWPKFAGGTLWWLKLMCTKSQGCIFKTVALRAFSKFIFWDLEKFWESHTEKWTRLVHFSVWDLVKFSKKNSKLSDFAQTWLKMTMG